MSDYGYYEEKIQFSDLKVNLIVNCLARRRIQETFNK